MDLDQQPRWLLLNRRAGWRALLLEAVEESPCDEGLRLVALPQNGRPLVDDAGTLGGLVAPTGVAVDARDRIYLVDRATARLKRFDPCCAAFEVLPCIGGEGSAPRRLRDPRGIALSEKGRLLLADSGNRRVQVFSLLGFALLMIWGPRDPDGNPVTPEAVPDPAGACPPAETWPAGTWMPWGITLGSRGRAYVTDHANGLVHCFDRHGCWRWARDGAAADSPALQHPTHIAADREGRLYVVQEGLDYVAVLDPEGLYLGRAEPPEHLRGRFCPGPLAAGPRGELYVVDDVERRLCRYCCPASPGGPVSYVAGSCPIGAPVGGVAFDSAGDPLLTLPASGQVVHLEGSAAFATGGRLVTGALDSGQMSCTWHRVAVEGLVPAGGAIRVDTLTAELPFDAQQVLELPEGSWATGATWLGPDSGSWDCLVLSPPGRYLWLRLTVTGPGPVTPLVRSVELGFPRLSSLRHLPAVYRAAVGADFLDRFLSIFDSLASQVDEKLDRLPGCLEPAAAPVVGGDFLTWLASWVGLSFDGTWSVAVRRRLLARAVALYGCRGTLGGLQEVVRIILGLDTGPAEPPVPGILEGFRLRRWAFAGASRLGDQTTLWGRRITDRLQLSEHSTIGTFRITDVGDPLRDPYNVFASRFTVFVPAARCRTEASRKAVERVIELTKPAHTSHAVEFVEPRFRVGLQATIGYDSAIGRYPAAVTAGSSRVGVDAVLGGPPGEPRSPGIRVGPGTRIGSAVL
jgi:phage tail-like protein